MNQLQLGNASIVVSHQNHLRKHRVPMQLGWTFGISMSFPNNPYAHRLKIQLRNYSLTIKERKKTMTNYFIN